MESTYQLYKMYIILFHFTSCLSVTMRDHSVIYAFIYFDIVMESPSTNSQSNQTRDKI